MGKGGTAGCMQMVSIWTSLEVPGLEDWYFVGQ